MLPRSDRAAGSPAVAANEVDEKRAQRASQALVAAPDRAGPSVRVDLRDFAGAWAVIEPLWAHQSVDR